MIKEIKINLSITNITEYLLLIFIIIVSSSVYNHSPDFNLYASEFVIIFSIILILLRIIKSKKRLIIIKELAISFIFTSIFTLIYLLFCNYTYSTDDIITIICKFIIFISIMYTYFVEKLTSENIQLDILDKFSKLIIIISLISLIFWFLGSILKIINNTNIINLSWGNGKSIKSYYNIYFETQKVLLGQLYIIRNSSIFAEAPMYSLSLTISLMYEIFLAQKLKMKRIFILIISILSSFSVTGICIAILFIGLKIMLIKSQSKFFILLKKIISFNFLLCAIVAIISLINFKSGSESVFCRIDDYIAAIKAWKDAILFGNGINNSQCIINYMNPERMSNTGLSNSLGTLLAQGGLYTAIFYLFPCINISLYSMRYKNYNIVCFILGILILFITTIFTYNFITMLFIALGYAYIKSKKYSNEINKMERKIV